MALNRAVAVAEVAGLAAALVEIAALERKLPGYHYLPAVKADLLRRLGRASDAAYREAIALAGDDVERAYLESRLTD